MAIYHFAVQILSRRAKQDKTTGRVRSGSNAVAAAAYRSGERLHDSQTGKVHDYSQRKGVAHAEIMAPEHTALELRERAKLWSKVEEMEAKRVDSQLSREINAALPHQLTHEQRVNLVRTFVQEEFVSRGMIADIALHDPVPENGDDRRNFHVHIQLTLRRVTAEGTLDAVKSRNWNSKDLLKHWRARWSDHCNEALRQAGRKERIDHRTLTEQRDEARARGDRRAATRLNRTPEVHVGPRARQVDAKAKERGQMFPSAVRPTGAARQRGEDALPQRRQRDYPATDRGTRVDWLSNILLGNNERAKARLAKTERQLARMQRKLTYWRKAAEFKLEGSIRGRAFRFERAEAACQERERRALERQRAEHAARRAALVKELIAELELVFAAARGGREAVLARQRETQDWRRRLTRSLSRMAEREQERSRTRQR